MNTTTTTTTTTTVRHRTRERLELPGRVARTSFLDRVAMRVALALLLWSSRPRVETDRDAVLRACERETRRAELDRVRAWQRVHPHHYR